MQFTYPVLLWALFLLLIPLFIHLFQLRRFKKTPFTNVSLLKKVAAESRRSRNLKKWLLLFTRMLLLAAMVFAFAQPFIASSDALKPREYVIYLDNSFSMQARTDDGPLLEQAIQDLIRAIPEDLEFSLFTNNNEFQSVNIRDIRNQLLAMGYTPEQLSLSEITLKAETMFDSGEQGLRQLILISDFQERVSGRGDSLSGIGKHQVVLRPEDPINASIDTAYISETTPNSLELTALLSVNGESDAIPVSLYNSDTLIAKTSASWAEGLLSQVVFTLPAKQRIDGRIEISDTQLGYDNQLFFSIDEKEKIKVLAIGTGPEDFLGRIFTDDEFDFRNVSLDNLNYSLITSQNLIVLNELESIPTALENALRNFVGNGGSLTLIPSANADIASYNRILSFLGGGGYGQKLATTLPITGISFSNPLFDQVFEDEVSNFLYPEVREYFRLQTNAPKILSLQGGDAFLAGTNTFYLFTAPLSGESSNFRNSPLIVPTFYNMGVNSLQLPKLYYQIGQSVQVDVPITPAPDRILKVSQAEYEFIPMQRAFANKTTLRFEDNPDRDGNFTISESEAVIKRISFNFGREESELHYMNPESRMDGQTVDSVAELFTQLEKEGSITPLWKWFVILAMLFMLAELLIQKFIK